MAESLWSQDSFTGGEFSPLMYSRITVEKYYNGLKQAKNAITLPQGAVEKRFGTKFWAEVPETVADEDLLLVVFKYLNECNYILIFAPNVIYVYLEQNLIATIENTTYSQDDILALDYTVIQDEMIVTAPGYPPKQIKRSDGGEFIKAEFQVGPAAAYLATIPAGTLDENEVYTTKITVGEAYGWKKANVGAGSAAINLLDGGQTLSPGITYKVFITANASDETFPTTLPAIASGTQYYLRGAGVVWRLYPTPGDAVANTNAYVFQNNGEKFTINIIHENESGVPPTPLDTITTYYIRAFNDTELRFYPTLLDAQGDINQIALTGAGTQPYYINATLAGNVIASIDEDANTLEITDALTADFIYPIRFGNIQFFSSVPAISDNKTYFLRMDDTLNGKVYLNIDDAAAQENELSLGTYTAGSFIAVENTWTLTDIEFKNLPAYDFNNINYDDLIFTSTFTANTTEQTLTASSAFFSKAYEGGLFIGSDGIARLETFQSATQFTIQLLKVFDGTVGTNVVTKGKVAKIMEPTWSDNRGWPTKCSSFQNRLIFANSRSLPNGIWLSAINGYTDFDDALTDDDDAISWYPSSNEVNFIRFLVPYRSLTVHTNTGVYSTDLGANTAITPRNFSLVLQESTPATAVKPRAIDNQVIVVSGNDVQSMLWDAYNNAYQTTIVSVMSEHLIRNPIDEAAYRDVNRAGSRYAFIVNEDGTLAIFQTLISENVAGFTPASLEQSYGTAKFKQVDSDVEDGCWFLIEREIAEASTAISISAVAGTNVTATATNFDTATFTACKFSAGVLPVTTPQIAVDTYYWAVGVDANNFKVYLTQDDATNDTNAISFTNAGTAAFVEPWPLVDKYYIEQLDFDKCMDCAETYSGAATSTISVDPRYNAQSIMMNGDNAKYTATVVNDEFDVGTNISEAQYGFGIHFKVQPLALANAIGSSIRQTNLVFPKHVRTVSMMFNDSQGGTANGKTLPITGTGTEIFEISAMKSWNDFQNTSITIDHTEPYPMRLLGLFYKIDI